MAFTYDYSKELEDDLSHFSRKNRAVYLLALKKIEEISSRDSSTIDFYKNLRYDMSDYKRVHIAKKFVLTFRVNKRENFILFERLVHHNEAYN